MTVAELIKRLEQVENKDLQGMLGGSNHYNGLTPNQIASDSYKYANAIVNKLMEESQHK